VHNYDDCHFSEISSGGVLLKKIVPPGAGKAILAKLLADIILPLILEEAFETTKIRPVAGKVDDNTSLMVRRHFSSPRHTISDVVIN
jgi:magnesium chelatase family protein